MYIIQVFLLALMEWYQYPVLLYVCVYHFFITLECHLYWLLFQCPRVRFFSHHFLDNRWLLCCVTLNNKPTQFIFAYLFLYVLIFPILFKGMQRHLWYFVFTEISECVYSICVFKYTCGLHLAAVAVSCNFRPQCCLSPFPLPVTHSSLLS